MIRTSKHRSNGNPSIQPLSDILFLKFLINVFRQMSAWSSGILLLSFVSELLDFAGKKSPHAVDFHVDKFIDRVLVVLCSGLQSFLFFFVNIYGTVQKA